MRLVWCGFALGVWGLQQQAVLPGWRVVLLLVLAALLAGGGAYWALAGGARGRLITERSEAVARAKGSVRAMHSLGVRWRRAVGWLALGFAAVCIGFGYASYRAQQRLSVALPAAWQARDIELTGYIAGLPSRTSDGARFVFAVDRWDAGSSAALEANLPRTVALTWIARDAPLPPLVPGARWRLAVRLKRPHAERNFDLRDGEAAMLARGVRATGYVSSPEHAVRLPGDAHGMALAIARWRAAVRARIDAVLADAPHRGIVVALAIGAQDAVTEDDWRLLRNTGTSHLVAISGLHLAFVSGLAGWLASALWRRARWRGVEAPLLVPAQKIAVVGAVCAAVVHAALAGFNVPVQRALAMLGVAAVAVLSERNVSRSTVLAWALGLVLLWDPWAVTAAGFWLSFGAVGAILFAVMGAPVARHGAHDGGPREVLAVAGPTSRVQHGIDVHTEAADEPRAAVDTLSDAARRVPSGRIGQRIAARGRLALAEAFGGARERLLDATRAQWAVTLALAPLTAWWFAQIPLVGPLANAFAIPFVSVLVTPAVLLGVASPAPLDAAILRAAHTLIALLATGLGEFGRVPWAVLRLPKPDALALACAVLGAAWCLAPRGWPLRWIGAFMWLPLLVPAPTGPPAGTFRLTALDVGQGSSVLIETARHRLLFDTGTGAESTNAGERIVVPYLQTHGIARLDTLMISHDDSDHSGGARAVLGQIAVGQFVAGMLSAQPLWAEARAIGTETQRCRAGQRWQWDGVDFEVLWPDAVPVDGKTNEHCCVLRVSTAFAAQMASTASTASTATALPDAATRRAALLAADIEAPTERTLVARGRDRLRADVLVVPHHGSRTSSTEPFLDSVWPRVAIFQVGYLNRFHHPHPVVYARYGARDIVLARTDTDGAVRVEVRPDGIEVERHIDTQRRYWMDVSNNEKAAPAGTETRGL